MSPWSKWLTRQVLILKTYNASAGSTPAGDATIKENMNTLNVKDHVIDNQKVSFLFYRSGILYYETEKGLIFEVPISDCGDTVFKKEDKAIIFMRWIRKQIEAIKNGEVETIR